MRTGSTVAWDQAPHWGKRKKNRCGRKKKSTSEATLFPSPDFSSALFALRFVFPFFAHCGAWSQTRSTGFLGDSVRLFHPSPSQWLIDRRDNTRTPNVTGNDSVKAFEVLIKFSYSFLPSFIH